MSEEKKEQLAEQPEKTETAAEPEQKAEAAAPQETPKKKNPNSVFTYIAILFGVAFLLLLLSYFMQQRNTAKMLEGLHNSNTAMENIEMLQTRNLELEKEVDTLNTRLDELEEQAEQLQDTEARLEAAEGQAKALDLFWQVVKAYEEGAFRTCRSLISQMKADGLDAHLEQLTDAAALFAKIQEALA